MKDTLVHNNTIFNTRGSAVAIVAAKNYKGPMPVFTFHNNIFVSRGPQLRGAEKGRFIGNLYGAMGDRGFNVDGYKDFDKWVAATGQEGLTLKGHTDFVTAVAYSPDGKRLATASTDRTVKVWDSATGQEVLSLKGQTGSVAFSPDGKRIVTGSGDNTVKVWDADTGQELFSLNWHKGAVSSVAFSPDGRRIVSGSTDRTAKVWDAR
jgi:WD40 repeat protein